MAEGRKEPRDSKVYTGNKGADTHFTITMTLTVVNYSTEHVVIETRKSAKLASQTLISDTTEWKQ